MLKRSDDALADDIAAKQRLHIEFSLKQSGLEAGAAQIEKVAKAVASAVRLATGEEDISYESRQHQWPVIITRKVNSMAAEKPAIAI